MEDRSLFMPLHVFLGEAKPGSDGLPKMLDPDVNSTGKKIGYLWYRKRRKGDAHDVFTIYIPKVFIWKWEQQRTDDLSTVNAIELALERFYGELGLGFMLTLYAPHRGAVQYMKEVHYLHNLEYKSCREIQSIIEQADDELEWTRSREK